VAPSAWGFFAVVPAAAAEAADEEDCEGVSRFGIAASGTYVELTPPMVTASSTVNSLRMMCWSIASDPLTARSGMGLAERRSLGSRASKRNLFLSLI
jgi:hypothetical protein